MTLLPVSEARRRILEGVRPLNAVSCDIEDAIGLVLADDLEAQHTQPSYDASAMDGYAVRSADFAGGTSNPLVVIGAVPAGHPLDATVGRGEAARIFTGGMLPAGADTVVPQEGVEVLSPGIGDQGSVVGSKISIQVEVRAGKFFRPAGMDFREGEALLKAGTLLTGRALTLAAAMGWGRFWVRRAPRVAILATGDELVAPGMPPGPGQVISSIPIGLAAMTEAFGGKPTILGIASDTLESLDEKLRLAAHADVLVTIGGASVGDHDLVQSALKAAGMTLDFWRIAARPGKPLMFARRGSQRVLGLPGNPVSALVTARLFLVPLIGQLLGRENMLGEVQTGVAGEKFETNGPREHYMRTRIVGRDDTGRAILHPVESQDSSLMSLLATADALAIRAPGADAVEKGGAMEYMGIDF